MTLLQIGAPTRYFVLVLHPAIFLLGIGLHRNWDRNGRRTASFSVFVGPLQAEWCWTEQIR